MRKLLRGMQMKITKSQLENIIREELSLVKEGGLHYDGLMEIMVDALRSELATWHPEAKAQVYDELASSGLDLTKAALGILDDDAGRHPGGTIGEDTVAEQGGASVRSFESDVENIVSRAQAAGIPDQDLAEVLQMYAADLGGNF